MPVTEPRQSRSVALYAPLGTFSAEQGPAAFAPVFCRAVNASLTGLLFNIEANSPPSAQARSLAAIEQESRERDAANAANVVRLEELCAAQGVTARTVTSIDHSRGMIGCVADHARLHDVLVIGSTRSGILGDRMMAESLLFETGRPLVVVPPSQTPEFAGKRIVVAWDNTRTSARALGDALSLLPDLKEVVLLMVGDEKAIRSSLDDAGLIDVLSRRGLSARIEHRALNGRKIGDALQDTAIEMDGALLVMGGCGHSRLRDFFLGGATMGVLDNPRLPILLSH
jgi:nucleotide-binding universal stress UspA family protein